MYILLNLFNPWIAIQKGTFGNSNFVFVEAQFILRKTSPNV